MHLLANEIEDLSNLGRSNMEETGRKCERPTQQGVLTVLDTWSNGLMGMLSTSVTGNLSDWTMVIEWNKPVSRNNPCKDIDDSFCDSLLISASKTGELRDLKDSFLRRIVSMGIYFQMNHLAFHV